MWITVLTKEAIHLPNKHTPPCQIKQVFNYCAINNIPVLLRKIFINGVVDPQWIVFIDWEVFTTKEFVSDVNLFIKGGVL